MKSCTTLQESIEDTILPLIPPSTAHGRQSRRVAKGGIGGRAPPLLLWAVTPDENSAVYWVTSGEGKF